MQAYAAWMRRLPPFFLALVLLVGATPGAVGAPSDAAVVAAVNTTSDAATLDLELDTGSSERVQLIGIVPDSSVCGTDATAQEQQLVAQGPLTFEPADVEVPVTGADAVGYIWLADGRNLSEVLLRQGQARSLPDPPHARSQQFAAAQAAAIAGQVGIWAPSACASASDTSATRAGMGGFVISSLNTIQQARLGVEVLRQQAASAPAVGSTPEWQRTTAMAISWMRGASRPFENSSARSDPAEPERAELATFGQRLDSAASAAELAAAAGDVAQLQSLEPQLDALDGGLANVATELNGLAVAYTLGD
jgi:endonuclease YncB( thermonuclease family)